MFSSKKLSITLMITLMGCSPGSDASFLEYMALKITYWGVRGSLPSAPSPEARKEEVKGLMKDFFASSKPDYDSLVNYLDQMPVAQVGGFGANTTCVEVRHKDTLLVIDGGTGVRSLSEKLLAENSVPKVIHFYMTHFHWDHVIGLPFFAPFFFPGHEIHFYSPHEDLEKNIRDIFKKPHFPVPFEALGSKIVFHQIKPRVPTQIEEMQITPYRLDHPDPCWGVKVEAEGKAYAHCVDTECTRNTREDLGEDLPLYQGLDLMYFDAQYSLPELAEKANWGHSASPIGIDLALREEIPKVLFAHHDPNATYEYMQRIEEQTRIYYEWKLKSFASAKTKPSVDWSFAFEGLSVEI